MAENNLALWGELAPVPDNAKKKIQGGKLNGKTDINPIWRLKMLTEKFGRVGFGWYTEVKEHWTEVAEGESSAWVRIHLFVKDPDTGEWSRPIEGIGGSKQNGKGQGDGINDEAFKMAETDAISVACKKMGMAASVYWDKDTTKYTSAPAPQQPAPQQPAPAQRPVSRRVIAEGNELWQSAIDACTLGGYTPQQLSEMYYIADADMAKLTEIVRKQKELGIA